MAGKTAAKPEASPAGSFDEPAGVLFRLELTAEQLCALWAVVQSAEEDCIGRGNNYIFKADIMASIRTAAVAALDGSARRAGN